MGDEAEKIRDSRRELLDNLDKIIETALVKFGKQRASNRDRQAWARVVIAAVSEFGKILRDVDLDELKARLDALEARG